MSDSTWNDDRITAYVLDELTPEDRAAFEDEMAENQELGAAVDEARKLTEQLQDHFAAEQTPGLDASRRRTIVAPVKPKSWKLPAMLLATAAALLLLIGGPLWMADEGVAMLGKTSSDAEEAQIASDDELLQYGKEAASGPPIEAYEEASRGVALEGFQQPAGNRLNDMRDGRPMPKKMAADAAVPLIASSPAPNQTRPVDNFSNASRPPSQRSRRRVKSLENLPSTGLARNAGRSEPSRFEAGGGGMGGAAGAQPETEVGKPPILRRERVLLGGPVNPDRTRYDFELADDFGAGPGAAGDRFDPITDNPFRRVAEHPLSTFSVDVDTASYSKTRDFLLRANRLPRPDAVRIEELINYFDYDYDPPSPGDDHPFTTHTVVTSCPWNREHRLARIAIKGREIQHDQRPRCNLVFLLDTSGSMNAPNKLPLVIEGMQMLLDQLDEDDRVAITVYAGSAGLVLDSTSAADKRAIRRALTRLSAGGSTNGGAGIQLAYQTARDHFIAGGVNRVILCTDGDFNVGTTGTDALVRMVEAEAQGGIFLSVLAFGMGNHNDAMLEQISGRGNGNYAFIDTQNEARKVLVDQTNSTLVTIAKDVKLQIEFNPAQVSSYRLIGYENRVLAKEDFNDDQKDAGEIGAGHAVTALYEIVPAQIEADAIRPRVDELKYQTRLSATDAAERDELMTLKLRYKQPDGDTSTLVEFPVSDDGGDFQQADADVRFAAAVAGFGMQLRRSEYRGQWTLTDVRQVAQSAIGEDRFGLRAELVELVQQAAKLMGEE